MPLLTTSALIDTVLSYVDNIDGTDAASSTRRTRILQYAQETVEEFWDFHEWRFKVKGPTTLVIPAWTSTPTYSSANLPSDFDDIGKIGSVYNSANGDQLDEITIQEMQIINSKTSAVTGRPEQFAIMGSVGDTDTTTESPHWLVLPNLSAAVTVRYWYQPACPTLVDATGNTNNLYKIPGKYHTSVILPGVAARSNRSKGDGRDWWEEYRSALAKAKADENPRRSSTQRLPRAIRNKW